MHIDQRLLCMGHHWTEDEANLRLKGFAAQWHDRATWEARATQIRKGIIQGMQLDSMPTRNNALKPLIHSFREMDGYRVANIALPSFPGFYITGNLYFPAEVNEQCPAVLCPHGHLPDKRFTDYVQYRSAAFARMGAVVFAYDMVGFGECLQVEHHNPIALLLQTYNSQRVLDYLLSRTDVDATCVGVTGCSGGGTQTFILTAIDERVTAAAPVAQVSAHFFGGCVCESGMPIHKSTHLQTNNVEIAALCAPRPLLLLSDGEDWTRNTPRVEYPYIQRIYAQYDAEHKVENVHLPGERHDYGYNKRVAVYNFFAHHLGLNNRAIPYDNGYQEDFVTLLPRDELCVFTDEHPRPADALLGIDAVMDALNFTL